MVALTTILYYLSVTMECWILDVRLEEGCARGCCVYGGEDAKR